MKSIDHYRYNNNNNNNNRFNVQYDRDQSNLNWAHHDNRNALISYCTGQHRLRVSKRRDDNRWIEYNVRVIHYCAIDAIPGVVSCDSVWSVPCRTPVMNETICWYSCYCQYTTSFKQKTKHPCTRDDDEWNDDAAPVMNETMGRYRLYHSVTSINSKLDTIAPWRNKQ